MVRLSMSLGLASLLMLSSGCSAVLEPESEENLGVSAEKTYYSLSTLIEKLASSGIPCETTEELQSIAEGVFQGTDAILFETANIDASNPLRVWFSIEVFDNGQDLSEALEALCEAGLSIDSRLVLGENWILTNSPELTGLENTSVVEAIGGSATRMSDVCAQVS